MKLTVIGSTGSMSGPRSTASCYLVQARGEDPATGEERTWSVVLDLGPGSFGQLWRYLDPRDIDALLISHGHADHIADIISFYVFLKWHPEGPQNGPIMGGPLEVLDRVAQIDGYADAAEVSGIFAWQAVKEGSTFEVGPMRITAYPGEHPVESYGYRIEGPSDQDGCTETIIVAYTGDTDLCDGMAAMAHNAHVLLAECGFTDEIMTRGIHLSGSRAGSLAYEAGVEHLVLTHIQPWTDPAIPVAEARTCFSGPVSVAESGNCWTL